MKNIFDINTATEEYDGKVFYSARVSKGLEKILLGNEEKARKLLKRTLPYLIAEMVMTFICIAVIGNIVFERGIQSLSEIFNSLKSAAGCFLLLALIVVVHMTAKRKKDGAITTLDQEYKPKQDAFLKLAREELKIPEDRFEIEILNDPYETVKDWKYFQHKEYSGLDAMEVYQKGTALCFFSGLQEFKIPFDEIETIEKVNKKKSIEYWNKDTDYDEEPYKKYGVRPKRMGEGEFVIPAYYRVMIERNEEQYEILIPNYEEDGVQRIAKMIKENR